MIKHILLFALIILSRVSLDAQEVTTKTQNVDLDGDGNQEVITLLIHDFDGDFSHYTLKINNLETAGEHSYNVDGYLVVDIDKSDMEKEIAIHTPNANGPDEYIIYRYDGENIKRIGSTHSFTKFNGDGTIDVETFKSFWTKHDRYTYNKDMGELEWTSRNEYDINEEYPVMESFAVFPVVGSANTLGFVDKGEKIKITKVVISSDCNKSGAYSDELCDVLFYTTADGRAGSATLEDLIGKVDLPLQP